MKTQQEYPTDTGQGCIIWAIVFILLAVWALSASSQTTFNPAEWEKANRLENTLTLIQYGCVGLSFYGLETHESSLIWAGFLFSLSVELFKIDIEKRNLRLYFEPMYQEAVIAIPINRKHVKRNKKHKYEDN